jgi:hypothetical protein
VRQIWPEDTTADPLLVPVAGSMRSLDLVELSI